MLVARLVGDMTGGLTMSERQSSVSASVRASSWAILTSLDMGVEVLVERWRGGEVRAGIIKLLKSNRPRQNLGFPKNLGN